MHEQAFTLTIKPAEASQLEVLEPESPSVMSGRLAPQLPLLSSVLATLIPYS